MASVQLDAVKAVLRWNLDSTPRYLAEPDPKSSFIRFALHLNTTSALFEIQIPISYKQHTKTSAIYIHINPRSITSLKHFVERDLPDAVKPVFGSAIYLDLELNDAVTILIPSFISEPVAAARSRSGIILDSLYELVQTTSLRIYIPDDALSQDQLESLSTAAIQQLNQFSGPDYDISRWFTGRGAKVTTLAKPPPPSYNNATADQANVPLYGESTTFDPPTASHKRKRSRDATDKRGWEVIPNSVAIWDKLLELEAVVHHRPPPNAPGDQSQHAQELQAEIAKLQAQLTRCEKKVLDRETEMVKLQTQVTQWEKKALDREAEVAKLQTQLAQWEKKVLDLEAEIAGLRDAQDNADNEENVELIEIQDTIRDLEEKIDFITRGKDDDEFAHTLKEEILNELITRISRG
ncbi:hypothetical protein FGADI_9538 [Fusarium gaditjirri]|uniref:Uncharacterized protein n=1 Tax=Fusarium gaditjirri TaxID=282569 RepID=A0A8H4WST9_9HYPO|nr:hypothetical protein FGADI_9538 [Fusarium gaditjirri]